MGSVSTARDGEVAASILEFVESGAYPTAEDMASAQLAASALPALQSAISTAEAQLKTEIRTLSSSSDDAAAIDAWTSSARALQKSIARTRDGARAMAASARAGAALRAHAADARARQALLRRELAFREGLAGALETLQVAAGLLDAAARAAAATTDEAGDDGEGEGGPREAVDKVLAAERVLGGVGGCEGSRFWGLMERRRGVVRGKVAEAVRGWWYGLVVVDADAGSVTVNAGDDPRMSLAETVEAMGKLGMLEPAVARLHRDLDAVIIGPQMDSGRSVRVSTTANSISLAEADERPGPIEKIDDVCATVNFITGSLPPSISSQLLDQILPSLILQLVSGWLDPSMPMKLDDAQSLETFQAVTDKTSKLSQFISKTQTVMPSDADLDAWLQRIPQTWLARRKEAALVDLRTASYDAVRQRKVVEKVETQLVSSDDVMYGSVPAEEDAQKDDAEDDWNASWGEDEADEAGNQEATGHEPGDSHRDSEVANDGQEQESWDDWGDEADQEKSPPPAPAKPAIKDPSEEKTAAPPPAKPAPPKEITLRETYTITHIPDALTALITRVLDDAALLSAPTFPVPALAAAVPGLATVPTLLLAMYRATASAFYANEPAADVLAYNDAGFLASELPPLVEAAVSEGQHPLSRRLRTLDADAEQLRKFARRAYGREMASQRTVLLDALAGAAGFVNCTLPLNARHYSQIVRDAAARAREVGAAWRGVLPESARLQALGGLVGALARQVVADVLERADDPQGISEEQSAMLKRFCDEVAALADMFVDPADATRTLVHVYVPGWLRFVYLGEILEASLADIRYLWKEGELPLEFEAGEVVELVQALFADSQHRRDAVREIKRASVIRS